MERKGSLSKAAGWKSGVRPNILFIMTDEQRFDQFGRMSGGYFETPNLDRLAESGVIFENATSTCTVCVPARHSLITGIYPHRFPLRNGSIHTPMREGHWTVAHALRESGYHTGHIGKGHYHPINARHGYEVMKTAEHLHTYRAPHVDDYTRYLVWEGIADCHATGIFGRENPEHDPLLKKHIRQKTADPFPYDRKYHVTDWVARESIGFLESRDRSKPYFLFSSFPAPHTPYNPPEPYASIYDPSREVVPVEDFDEINGQLPPVAYDMLNNKNGYGFGYEKVRDLHEGVMQLVHSYIRAMCKQIDDAIGEIMKHVDLSTTVVIFSTDHGDYCGRRGLIYKCPFMPFEDLAKVPLFMTGAGISQGTVSNLVQNFDLTPTSLELAEIEPPAAADFDAESLLGFADGKNQPDHRRVVYCANQGHYDMVRRENVKYFRHTESGEEMLFDLVKDPHETQSLIGDPAYSAAESELRKEFNRVMALQEPSFPEFPI